MSVCSTVGGIGCDSENKTLADVTGDAAVGAIDHSRLAGLMQGTFEGLLSPSGFQDKIIEPFGVAGNAQSSEVAKEKATLASGAAEPDPMSVSGGNGDERMQQIADEFNKYYLESSAYTIAWKMAQRIQQDISHIMKG